MLVPAIAVSLGFPRGTRKAFDKHYISRLRRWTGGCIPVPAPAFFG